MGGQPFSLCGRNPFPRIPKRSDIGKAQTFHMNGSRRPAGRADLCVGRSPLILRFGHIAEFESLRITPLVRLAGPEPCEGKTSAVCHPHNEEKTRQLFSRGGAETQRSPRQDQRDEQLECRQCGSVAGCQCQLRCRLSNNHTAQRKHDKNVPVRSACQIPVCPPNPHPVVSKKIEKLSVCRKKMLKSDERACQTHVKR